MAEMTGAQAMFEMCVREGVRYIFGNPGTTELPLMDLFADRNEIEYILALHEDSAVGIAVGYAEASGKPAVVNLHTAPGLAHGLGNLYNAKRAGTPLIVTAGQQDTRVMIQEPLLYGDMLEAVRQYTKWSWEARHASDIPAAFARAFKVATTPPTGPVFISLPVNAMEERAELELPDITRVSLGAMGADPRSIAKAADLLASAKVPAIIAGDGCARGGAVADVVKLADALGALVYTEPLNSLLDFPTGHPLYGGPMFPNGKQTQAQLQGVDVVLLLGVNMLAPLVYTGDRIIPEGVRIIQVDTDDRELGKNYPAEVAIHADIAPAVKDLAQALTTLTAAGPASFESRRNAVAAKIAEMRARYAEGSGPPSEGKPMSPAFVAREMRAAAAADALLVDEAVTSTAFVRTGFELREPGSYFYAKGGSLGLGIPEAVGVKLARPDRQVLCAVGDGSAMYSIQALWSAARYKIGVTFVVFNNTSYMILKGGLTAMKGASARKGVFPGMDINEPEIDFVKLAESMGVAGQHVVSAPELLPALEWALSEKGPTLLDVRIARDVRSVLR